MTNRGAMYPFLDAARAKTMKRDFDRLRERIRAWDCEGTEEAWEKCERWIDCLNARGGLDD